MAATVAALPVLARAYELGANVTTHDAMYVALTETLACSLLTVDAKLAAGPGAALADRSHHRRMTNEVRR